MSNVAKKIADQTADKEYGFQKKQTIRARWD